jgi:hypothetical protein
MLMMLAVNMIQRFDKRDSGTSGAGDAAADMGMPPDLPHLDRRIFRADLTSPRSLSFCLS